MSTRTILDPTGEQSVAERARLARPGSLHGLTVGLLDISKPRRRRVPRSDRGTAHRDRRERQALQEADVREAGTGRPPPRDHDRMPGGDRSTCRLRQLHVVQCARHQRSGDPRRTRRVRGVQRVRHRRRGTVEVSRLLGDGASVHAPPDPGPHRRRDGRVRGRGVRRDREPDHRRLRTDDRSPLHRRRTHAGGRAPPNRRITGTSQSSDFDGPSSSRIAARVVRIPKRCQPGSRTVDRLA